MGDFHAVNYAPPRHAERHAVIQLAAPKSSLRILAVGDLHGIGAMRAADAIRRYHQQTPLDAILILGDNFDRCGVESLQDAQWGQIRNSLSPLGIPLYPILGNHDYGDPKRRLGQTYICGKPSPAVQIGASSSLANWHFPSRSYVLSTPLAELIMIDTVPIEMGLDQSLLGSETAEQVERFAMEHLDQHDGRWKIVVGHHNIGGSGILRANAEETRRNMSAFGERLWQRRADLYVCGHQHQLELLAATGDAPMRLISGTGGRPKTASSLRRRDEDSFFLSTVPENSVGFAVLEIEPASIRIRFHDANGLPMSRTFDLHGPHNHHR